MLNRVLIYRSWITDPLKACPVKLHVNTSEIKEYLPAFQGTREDSVCICISALKDKYKKIKAHGYETSSLGGQRNDHINEQTEL